MQARFTAVPVRTDRRAGCSGAGAKATGLLLLVQLILGVSPALGQGITGLFPPAPSGYVTDQAGVVSPGDRQAMTDLIERLKAATSADIAVVTLPTIGDYPESQVALEIGRAWGVGSAAEIGDPRRNNGVVLLLVPRQGGRPGTGAVFIATGQGLEGMITDARAGQVRELMRPQLVEEQYGAALRTGTEALVALIARGYGVSDSALTAATPEPVARQRPVPAWSRFIPLAVFVIIVLLLSRGGGGRGGRGGRRRGGGIAPWILLSMLGGGRRGGGWGGGGWGGGGFGGGGFGGFGGGGGFSGGGAGGRF